MNKFGNDRDFSKDNPRNPVNGGIIFHKNNMTSEVLKFTNNEIPLTRSR